MRGRGLAPRAGPGYDGPVLIDTHCHLTMDPLWSDLDGVLGRAADRGVTDVVVPAYDLASWERVTSLAGRQGVHVAFGLHPWAAAEDLDQATLDRALEEHGAVAVGEIGLDFKVDGADRERQRAVLRAQIDVAASRDLPVLLHCRGAFEELLSLLADYRPLGLRGAIHAFSRGPELARRFAGAGLAVAFGGAITRPRADRARRAAAALPLDRVLLETDAPSISLEGVPPEQVEPGHVRDVAEALASLRGATLEEVAGRTMENAKRLLGLD
jgi:TatD DNase family protein